jgi:NTE family protein
MHRDHFARRRLLLCGAAACVTPPWLSACGDAQPALAPDEEPLEARAAAPARCALVLSGGGLRGFAHVGVLRALRQLGIEPDLVVGTSIGALIGGLFASGASLDAAERLATAGEFDPWTGLFVSPEMRSSSLDAFLRQTLAWPRIEDFPRRFVAVATQRTDGLARAFDRGDAARAILASAALPGALMPVTIAGREFVDGGLSRPLPVRLARALGARHVVAVDVSFHPEVPAPSDRIGAMFHAGFLMGRNLAAADRDAADVLIEPALPPVPEITVAKRAGVIDSGERATLAQAAALYELAAT